MSGCQAYFSLVIVILLPFASTLYNPVSIDLNEVIKSNCSDDGWSLTESESIPNSARLIPTKLLKASSFSCASFPINITSSGSLDISVYVDSSSEYSGLVLLVDDGVNDAIIEYEYRKPNNDFKQGWHTISLPINKRINAEVTLLGFSDGEDLILIDSITYNRKSIKPLKDWTSNFAETETIILAPYNFERISKDQDKAQYSVTQEKSKQRDEREINENDSDYPKFGSNIKSGKVQLIEIDNLIHIGNDKDHNVNSINGQVVNKDNIIDDQLKKSMGDGNDKSGNGGYINGENKNGENENSANGNEGNRNEPTVTLENEYEKNNKEEKINVEEEFKAGDNIEGNIKSGNKKDGNGESNSNKNGNEIGGNVGDGNKEGGEDENEEGSNGEDVNVEGGEDGNGEGGNGQDGYIEGGEDGNEVGGSEEDGNNESSEDGNEVGGNGEDGNEEGGNHSEDVNVESSEDGNEEIGSGEDGNVEGSEDGNEEGGSGEDGTVESSEDGNEEGGSGEGGTVESSEDENEESGNGEGSGEAGNGEDGNEDSDNGGDGNGDNGNGENGSGEEPNPEQVQQGNDSFWNTWTILLVTVGSATVLGLVLAAAYHLGKIRGKDIPLPIDLSDLEAPRIIPRVKSVRPTYERFGGSEYGSSSPELFAR